jgi:hypothetical protein
VGEGEGNPAIPKCSVEVRVAHLQSNWKVVVRGRRLTRRRWFLVNWEKLVILSEGELVVFVVLAMCRSEAIGALLIAK